MNRIILFVCVAILCAQAQAQVATSTNTPTSNNTPAPGKALNPDISANFLGLLQRGTGISNDRTESVHNGLTLQEVEIQFTADVDPYFRGAALLAVAQEGGGTDFGIDPEEIYLETLSIPRLTLKAGKINLAVGKHNLLHTHAYPFIDAPLINQTTLGDEGLNDSGLSAALLLPTPWFFELTAQVFNLSNADLFGSTSSGDLGQLVHAKNLWDLSDDTTLEWGLTGVAGHNSTGENATLWGSNLTFKWRPAVGGKYQAFIWSTEYLNARRPGATDSNTSLSTEGIAGLTTWVQYQIAQRWWIQGRYEALGVSRSEGINPRQKQSALLGFFPSEFSGIRLQYDHINTEGKETQDHTLALQYNISIGAHPAHVY